MRTENSPAYIRVWIGKEKESGDSFTAACNRLLTGGWAREVTARELPVAMTLASGNMRLKPFAIRELLNQAGEIQVFAWG